MAAQPWMKLWVGDILSDPRYRLLKVEGRAVYFAALMEIHQADDYKVSGTQEELCVLFGLDPEVLRAGIEQIGSRKILEVTPCHGSHALVTLMSRERFAEYEEREKARLRKQKQRNKESDTPEEDAPKSPCHAPVTDTHAGARADSDSVSVSLGGGVEGGEGSVRGEEEDEEEDQFNEFWGRYEKKVGRAAARKAWGRLTKRDRLIILSHVDHFVEATPEIQYRPHASTYINAKRYLDDALPDGRLVTRETADGTSRTISRATNSGRVLDVRPAPLPTGRQPGTGGSNLPRTGRRSAREISEQSLRDYLGDDPLAEGRAWGPTSDLGLAGTGGGGDQTGRLQLVPATPRRSGVDDGIGHNGRGVDRG